MNQLKIIAVSIRNKFKSIYHNFVSQFLLNFINRKSSNMTPKYLPTLSPIASVKSRNEFEISLQNSTTLKHIKLVETGLLSSLKKDSFMVDGLCVPCGDTVSFLVDMKSGGQRHETGWIPNWRERLECPKCLMNNRQRLIATLIKQTLSFKTAQHIYFMEQVTPIFNWAIATFKNHDIAGSEYLGYEYKGGQVIKGIRHEDVEQLSFSDGELDLIVSNDVFEHVPNPSKAFHECARVLKSAGTMLTTFPFHSNRDISESRAQFIDGKLEHILSPDYHGNPLSADGSLVFTDFGWDVVSSIECAGFSNVCVEIYSSTILGHLGGGQIVFRATK